MNIKYYLYISLVLLLFSCSSTKYVPQGQYLLSSVSIKSDKHEISSYDLEPFVKQDANFKTFELAKIPLFVYNLSGKDTTNWFNRTLRNWGEAPVVYDSTMVNKTVKEFKHILSNKGYLDAKVVPNIVINEKKRKVKVQYNIYAGNPSIIADYNINIEDSVFSEEIYSASSLIVLEKSKNKEIDTINLGRFLKSNTLVKPNSNFNLDVLDSERGRIASIFKNSGFYGFNKEYIGFVADTTLGNNKIGLELVVYPTLQKEDNKKLVEKPHNQYSIGNLYLYLDYDPITDGDLQKFIPSETIKGDGYTLFYGKRGKYIHPQYILNNCYILPGALYNDLLTKMTYNSLGQLDILRNVSITYNVKDSLHLDCVITCVPNSRQGTTFEVEGTNSAGFFGVGAGLGYIHRNIFKGSERFNIKLDGGYESVTPNFTNFSDNYFELRGEMSLTFPRFINPLVPSNLKRRLQASTQLSTNYSFQRRPGLFTRTVLAGGVKYLWNNRRNNSIRHTIDLVDLNYVHLPKKDLNEDFLNELTPEARLYSFEDQFILGAGYTYYNSNFSPINKNQPVIQTIRASVQTAGNVLALYSKIANIEADADGSLKVFNTTFSQYVKGSVDYSRTYRIDDRNSLAWRLGGGLAYPYGNSKLIPIQKRFFAGGANSVRGWAIRELGPGSYYSTDDVANFYYHSGDIRFDANMEYRSKAFWIVEFAAFFDAGNIWTVRDYEKQEGGKFKLNSFYKEIAASWGLGIRLDFDFVLIRLDFGWKIYDPANKYTLDANENRVYEPSKSHWPIIRPLDFNKNTAWHIAVGYPF